MRIEGVPLEKTEAGVRRLYQDSIDHLGRVPLPLTALAHRPEIAQAYSALNAVLTGSGVVEPRLKTLACVRAAQIAGCTF
jgi:alkylhydroperoxidase family enzyme